MGYINYISHNTCASGVHATYYVAWNPRTLAHVWGSMPILIRRVPCRFVFHFQLMEIGKQQS